MSLYNLHTQVYLVAYRLETMVLIKSGIVLSFCLEFDQLLFSVCLYIFCNLFWQEQRNTNVLDPWRDINFKYFFPYFFCCAVRMCVTCVRLRTCDPDEVYNSKTCYTFSDNFFFYDSFENNNNLSSPRLG